ncbi:MAG: MBL fold metallo-hydrolase [Propionibacteriaceae bacterium]|jgi:metallo-beta-lactamase family protein|nr:MBL fold metallo-hydrolase [Propionibacteriaceae bacterium]
MANARSSLRFLGGAGTVTGSKYLLEYGDRRILIDAGLFQGEKKLRLLNWDSFPVSPRGIDTILLTHAHMDHVGYLPRLVKQGFSGPVWATDGSELLAEVVLYDSAKLQEHDAENAAKNGYSKHENPEPLYTTADVDKTLKLLRFADFGVEIDLGDGITARYYRAGHILGSASVHVTTPDAEVLFSGDLGRHDHPVLKGRETPEGAPTVLIESTYGDREHPDWDEEPHEDLAEAIRRTIARGGNVLIPAFAVDRTEVVLLTLNRMRAAARIPDVPIYINSPMGARALEIYQSPSQRDELREDLRDHDFLDMRNIRVVTSTEESIRLNRPSEPCIIISSSGMATGGRVVHHLEHMLPDARNTVVFTGYQAKGTRGRTLIDGATELKMFGKYVPVKAEVLLDDGFSVHADASDLMDWLKELQPRPKIVYCVHGEDGAPVLARRIRKELGITAVVPRLNEKVLVAGRFD